MIMRVDTRGGVHTPYTSVTSVTSVTRPVYAGCRGAKKKQALQMRYNKCYKRLPPNKQHPLKKGKTLGESYHSIHYIYNNWSASTARHARQTLSKPIRIPLLVRIHISSAHKPFLVAVKIITLCDIVIDAEYCM